MRPPSFSCKFQALEDDPLPLVSATFGSCSAKFPMLLDTGATYTFLPMEWMEALKHDNKNIKPCKIEAVGATNKSYPHSSQITILGDNLQNLWRSRGKIKVFFTDGLDGMNHGLIGRDIICGIWQQLTLTTPLSTSTWAATFIPRQPLSSPSPPQNALSCKLSALHPTMATRIGSHNAIFPMLLDTGASHTHLPAKWMKSLGHDNKNITPNGMKGMGATNKSYPHSSQITILGDNLQNLWKTHKIPVYFTPGLDALDCGLLGRDIICNMWEQLTFSTVRDRRTIEIYFTPKACFAKP